MSASIARTVIPAMIAVKTFAVALIHNLTCYVTYATVKAVGGFVIIAKRS
jgi:catabolite regulation protein CreA